MDYKIGGLSFLSAASPETPLDRQTAPYRKEQTDQSQEVGEQSLSFWWLRSQSSFHGGAGQKFLDGGERTEFRPVRFAESYGVDVWTPGEVKVLPPMVATAAPASCLDIIPREASGSAASFLVIGNNRFSVVDSGVDTAISLTGAPTSFSSLTSDGLSFYVRANNGIHTGRIKSPGTNRRLYSTTTALSVLGFVKGRLMAAGGTGALYELDSNAATDAVLPAPYYTHPVPEWSWGNFTEGPAGIYVHGYAGERSLVYRIGLTETTGVPVLNAPIQVLELPQGEICHEILGHLGGFLVLQTSKGVRVGRFLADGSVQVGPLTITKELASGVYADWAASAMGLVARDSFVYVGGDGPCASRPTERATFRIDLGVETAPGRYAWSSDQTTGQTNGGRGRLAISKDGRLLVGDSLLGVYETSFTAGAKQGNAFITSSRIRFSTSELKVFERLRVETDGNGADTITGQVVSSTGVVTGVNSTSTNFESRIGSTVAGKVSAYISVRLLFVNSGTTFKRLTGFQLKALPAQKRQRMERIPLLCFDIERDRNGRTVGHLNSAYDRLQALEALEEAGDVVTVERFGRGFTSADNRLAVIDEVRFQQTAVPNKTNGWGGIALVTVRYVD